MSMRMKKTLSWLPNIYQTYVIKKAGCSGGFRGNGVSVVGSMLMTYGEIENWKKIDTQNEEKDYADKEEQKDWRSGE